MSNVLSGKAFKSWVDFLLNRRSMRFFARKWFARQENAAVFAAFTKWIRTVHEIARYEAMSDVEKIKEEQRIIILKKNTALVLRSIQNFISSSLSTSFLVWKGLVLEDRQNKVVIARYVKRWKGMYVMKCFLTWVDLVVERRELRAVVRRFLGGKESLAKTQGFNTWKTLMLSEREEERRRKMKILEEQAENSKLEASQSERQVHLKSEKARISGERAAQSIFAKKLRGTIGMCLVAWKEDVKITKRLRLRMKLVFARMRNQQLSAAFQAWTKKISIDTRNLLGEVKGEREEARMQLNLARIEAKKLKEARMRKILAAWVSRHLYHAFVFWRDTVEEFVRHEMLIYKYASKLLRGGLLKVMNAWMTFTKTKKRHRFVVGKFIARYKNMTAARFFAGWKDWAKMRRKYAVIVGRFRSRMMNLVAYRAFNALVDFARKRKRKRELTWRILQRAKVSNFSSGFSTWAACVEEVRREQYVIGLFAKRWEKITLVRVYKAWAKVVKEERWSDGGVSGAAEGEGNLKQAGAQLRRGSIVLQEKRLDIQNVQWRIVEKESAEEDLPHLEKELDHLEKEVGILKQDLDEAYLKASESERKSAAAVIVGVTLRNKKAELSKMKTEFEELKTAAYDVGKVEQVNLNHGSTEISESKLGSGLATKADTADAGDGRSGTDEKSKEELLKRKVEEVRGLEDSVNQLERNFSEAHSQSGDAEKKTVAALVGGVALYGAKATLKKKSAELEEAKLGGADHQSVQSLREAVKKTEGDVDQLESDYSRARSNLDEMEILSTSAAVEKISLKDGKAHLKRKKLELESVKARVEKGRLKREILEKKKQHVRHLEAEVMNVERRKSGEHSEAEAAILAASVALEGCKKELEMKKAKYHETRRKVDEAQEGMEQRLQKLRAEEKHLQNHVGSLDEDFKEKQAQHRINASLRGTAVTQDSKGGEKMFIMTGGGVEGELHHAANCHPSGLDDSPAAGNHHGGVNSAAAAGGFSAFVRDLAIRQRFTPRSNEVRGEDSDGDGDWSIPAQSLHSMTKEEERKLSLSNINAKKAAHRSRFRELQLLLRVKCTLTTSYLRYAISSSTDVCSVSRLFKSIFRSVGLPPLELAFRSWVVGAAMWRREKILGAQIAARIHAAVQKKKMSVAFHELRLHMISCMVDADKAYYATKTKLRLRLHASQVAKVREESLRVGRSVMNKLTENRRTNILEKAFNAFKSAREMKLKGVMLVKRWLLAGRAGEIMWAFHSWKSKFRAASAYESRAAFLNAADSETRAHLAFILNRFWMKKEKGSLGKTGNATNDKKVAFSRWKDQVAKEIKMESTWSEVDLRTRSVSNVLGLMKSLAGSSVNDDEDRFSYNDEVYICVRKYIWEICNGINGRPSFGNYGVEEKKNDDDHDNNDNNDDDDDDDVEDSFVRGCLIVCHPADDSKLIIFSDGTLKTMPRGCGVVGGLIEEESFGFCKQVLGDPRYDQMVDDVVMSSCGRPIYEMERNAALGCQILAMKASSVMSRRSGKSTRVGTLRNHDRILDGSGVGLVEGGVSSSVSGLSKNSKIPDIR